MQCSATKGTSILQTLQGSGTIMEEGIERDKNQRSKRCKRLSSWHVRCTHEFRQSVWLHKIYTRWSQSTLQHNWGETHEPPWGALDSWWILGEGRFVFLWRCGPLVGYLCFSSPCPRVHRQHKLDSVDYIKREGIMLGGRVGSHSSEKCKGRTRRLIWSK